MNLKTWEVISIVLSAVVGGMFWGPWLALTRSISTFEPGVFLALVHRLNRNMAPLMTALMPVALLSIVPVLILSCQGRPTTFYLAAGALSMFFVALLVTVVVEVPIVNQIDTWTLSTLPVNWRELRDRWGAFHVVRVVAAIVGLVLLVVAVLF